MNADHFVAVGIDERQARLRRMREAFVIRRQENDHALAHPHELVRTGQEPGLCHGGCQVDASGDLGRVWVDQQHVTPAVKGLASCVEVVVVARDIGLVGRKLDVVMRIGCEPRGH